MPELVAETSTKCCLAIGHLLEGISVGGIGGGEDLFAAVVNSTTDAIIAIDSQGLVTFWNRAASRMFSRVSEDVLGKPLVDIMPERFRSDHQQGLQRLVRTGTSAIVGRTVEMVGLRADGTEFPIELTVSMWQSDGRHQFAGIGIRP